MIVFPNCKINIGLNIIRKREDGYHDLETVFFPIPFNDVLEIITSDKTELIVTGRTVNPDSNLCSKAYNLLKQDFPELPPVKIHLHKIIPLGAGLGGGSSDAAFTLQLLNEKFKLNIKNQQLINYALLLGSDCPFFIINKPCLAISRGEILEPIKINLSKYKILIIYPGIHIDTKWAFSRIVPQQSKLSVKEIITHPIETWKDNLKNDFETPVFAKYPEIMKIKNDLYKQGAAYASLSGSGSTVYGIFMKNNYIDTGKWKNYFYKVFEF